MGTALARSTIVFIRNLWPSREIVHISPMPRLQGNDRTHVRIKERDRLAWRDRMALGASRRSKCLSRHTYAADVEPERTRRCFLVRASGPTGGCVVRFG